MRVARTLVLRYFWSGGVMLVAALIVAVALARRDDLMATLLALPVPALAAGGVYMLLTWLIQLRTV